MGVNSQNTNNVSNNKHKPTQATSLPGNYELSQDGFTTNSRIRRNSRNQISTNFSNTSNQQNHQNPQNSSSNITIFSQNLPQLTKSENFANKPSTYKIASSSYTSNNTTSSSYTSNSSIPNPPPSENFIPNKNFTNLPKKSASPISSSNNLTKLYNNITVFLSQFNTNTLSPNLRLTFRFFHRQIFKMRALIFSIILLHIAYISVFGRSSENVYSKSTIRSEDGKMYFQKPQLDGYSPKERKGYGDDESAPIPRYLRKTTSSNTEDENPANSVQKRSVQNAVFSQDTDFHDNSAYRSKNKPRSNLKSSNSMNSDPNYKTTNYENQEDPLDDLNLARQRTRTWIGAMSNLSPAALSRLKRELEAKVHIAIRKLTESTGVPEEAKNFRQSLLDMFLEELMESERDMRNAIDGLRRSLTSDFRNPAELAANAKHRLDFLKVATMKEEQSMNKLEQINSNFDHYRQHVNGSTSIMDELMKDVSKAADLLESAMREHNEVAFQAGNIEAVMHLHDDDEDKTDFGLDQDFEEDRNDNGYNPAGNMKSRAEAQMQLDREFNAYGGVLGMDDENVGRNVVKEKRMDNMREKQEGESVDAGDILVDSQNNKYVLSKPKDTTTPLVNHHFASDIMLLLLIAMPMGFICHQIGLPCLFGYIMTGVLIGPSGFNQVEHIVQIETISEFGVFFIMFFAGLEFAPDKLRKVWKTAIQVGKSRKNSKKSKIRNC